MSKQLVILHTLTTYVNTMSCNFAAMWLWIETEGSEIIAPLNLVYISNLQEIRIWYSFNNFKFKVGSVYSGNKIQQKHIASTDNSHNFLLFHACQEYSTEQWSKFSQTMHSIYIQQFFGTDTEFSAHWICII